MKTLARLTGCAISFGAMALALLATLPAKHRIFPANRSA